MAPPVDERAPCWILLVKETARECCFDDDDDEDDAAAGVNDTVDVEYHLDNRWCWRTVAEMTASLNPN